MHQHLITVFLFAASAAQSGQAYRVSPQGVKKVLEKMNGKASDRRASHRQLNSQDGNLEAGARAVMPTDEDFAGARAVMPTAEEFAGAREVMPTAEDFASRADPDVAKLEDLQEKATVSAKLNAAVTEDFAGTREVMPTAEEFASRADPDVAKLEDLQEKATVSAKLTAAVTSVSVLMLGQEQQQLGARADGDAQCFGTPRHPRSGCKKDGCYCSMFEKCYDHYVLLEGGTRAENVGSCGMTVAEYVALGFLLWVAVGSISVVSRAVLLAMEGAEDPLPIRQTKKPFVLPASKGR